VGSLHRGSATMGSGDLRAATGPAEKSAAGGERIMKTAPRWDRCIEGARRSEAGTCARTSRVRSVCPIRITPAPVRNFIVSNRRRTVPTVVPIVCFAVTSLLAGCRLHEGNARAERARRSRVGLAEVLYIRDELVRSPSGDPLAVRLKIVVRVTGGEYYLTPFLFPDYDGSPPENTITFVPKESLLAGRNLKRTLDSGRAHEISFEMVPLFGGRECLPPTPPISRLHKLRIQIYDTTYHREAKSGSELPLTSNAYDLARIYFGQRASNRKLCEDRGGR
jgi:hypothetical protein